ncbi:MAG: leucyl/phenylalanyl-tRNA--protein transferase [Oleiphilaceae bacterium]|jgi:leucyl/phenylalanyl-tRNA--protein transferase
MSQLPWIEGNIPLPDPETALTEPNGLLAASYDLSPELILSAYKKGIFPWYSEDQPVLWWSPDPRCIIHPNELHLSKSLKKHIRKTNLNFTFDHAFEQVIHHCARLDSESGTWITAEMEEAYIELHKLGYAHSVEVWREDELIGGLYGLSLGRCFFGESMFSLETNASKIAFSALCQQLNKWGFKLIDCQVENPHLLTLGASTIKRSIFLEKLNNALKAPQINHKWIFDIEQLK